MIRFLVCLVSLAAVTTCSRQPCDAEVSFVPGADQISGRLSIYRTKTGVFITGQIMGLSPGLHGFHVHEKGDLGDGCKAAGGHFNPFGNQHGAPIDENRHVGDLGNIKADDYGIAIINIHDDFTSLNANSAAFIGNRAIVVHQGVDDLGRGGNPESLKTGNAGARSGCGIIVVHPYPTPAPQRPSQYYALPQTPQRYNPWIS